MVLVLAACSGGAREPVDPASLSFPPPPPQTAAPTTSAVAGPVTSQPVPKGGDVRLGIWADPDPDAPTPAGAGVRSLILPQLFTPTPEGGWVPSLVEPGSDVAAPDLRSASFRLREGARWSDGTPITVADLRAGADPIFVDSVTEKGGVITVRFNQPLPGWRRLWSGQDTVPAPRPGLYGGPWQVQSRIEGLRTVLVPNPRWWGTGPYLDSLTLVAVPDQGIMIELLAAGELDLVAPWPAPGVGARLVDIPAIEVSTGAPGGWQMELVANPERLSVISRQAALGALDPYEMVGALIPNQAVVPADGSASPDPTVAPGSLRQESVITLAEDVPLQATVARAVQFAVRDGGGVVPEQRAAPSDVTESWLADHDFDLAAQLVYLGPDPCWTCRWGWVDEARTRLTDGGADPADMERVLSGEAVRRVLWQPLPLVAWNQDIHGPQANGFAPSAAWNSESWWREP